MKVRSGFVSNSSSCSFICDICGESHNGTSEGGGWHIKLYSTMAAACPNGHVFCEGHLSGKSDHHELEEDDCPICSLKLTLPGPFGEPPAVERENGKADCWWLRD